MRAIAIALMMAWAPVAMAQEAEPEPEPESESESEPESEAEPEPESESEQAPLSRSRERAGVRGDEAESNSESESEAEPPPRTDVSAVLGTATIVSLLGTVMAIGFLVERIDAADACASFLADDPPTRGCLNAATIRDQRDVSIGFAIGVGALTLGLAAGWIIAALTRGPPAPSAGLACDPAGLGVACRF